MTEDHCPICGTTSNTTIADKQWSLSEYDCIRCGTYIIPPDIKSLISQSLIVQRSVISHFISKRRNKKALLTHKDISNIFKNTLPTPAEQANNLILFLGTELGRQSEYFPIKVTASYRTIKNIKGLIGIKIGNAAEEHSDLKFLIHSLLEQKIIKVDPPLPTDTTRICLTFEGWQKYEELKRSVQDSRKAFIAMEFYDKEKEKTEEKDYYFQNILLPDCLVPAVKDTDFELTNPLSDKPKAGNIHARMEVEIRTSRFVIAELSHHNNNAYWEAGFARGLGKPVIYMYNRKIGKQDKPPFDVGSDHIVFWDDEKTQKEIAEELKGIIRNTISDARMTDKIEG